MFQRAHLSRYSLLLVFFLASCPDDTKDSSGDTEDNQDTLTLTSITPDHAFEGDDADVVLLGTGFAEGVTAFIGS